MNLIDKYNNNKYRFLFDNFANNKIIFYIPRRKTFLVFIKFIKIYYPNITWCNGLEIDPYSAIYHYNSLGDQFTVRCVRSFLKYAHIEHYELNFLQPIYRLSLDKKGNLTYELNRKI